MKFGRIVFQVDTVHLSVTCLRDLFGTVGNRVVINYISKISVVIAYYNLLFICFS